MDTNPVSTTTQTAAPTASSENRSVLNSDFEVFLQMLTAQARYQDPLEPMDSSEYAAQLAQFSMVEQQVFTNELMEKMVAAFTESETGKLAEWIGMDVLSTAPTPYDGTPVTIVPNPPKDAQGMALLVYDANGQQVLKRPVEVSDAPITWSGDLTQGGTAAPGDYTFKIESTVNGQTETPVAAPSYSRVVESRLTDGNVQLVLSNGQKVESDNVTGLRPGG